MRTMKKTNVTLYHGTERTNLESILQYGFDPTKKSQEGWGNTYSLGTDFRATYMTPVLDVARVYAGEDGSILATHIETLTCLYLDIDICPHQNRHGRSKRKKFQKMIREYIEREYQKGVVIDCIVNRNQEEFVFFEDRIDLLNQGLRQLCGEGIRRC